MQALIDVLLPVFLVIGAGYAAVWFGLLGPDAAEGLNRFTHRVGIPALLFQAIWRLDLSSGLDTALLASFYLGAATGFALGFLGARHLFRRDVEDAIAIGFICLFSNSVMLGLALTQRAFGADELAASFTIVAFHSPFCYGLGITAMEIARSRGAPAREVPGKVARAMFRNALVVGIMLGFAFNLASISLPGPVTDALDLVVRTALPLALFGMGGVLVQYRLQGDLRIIAYVCVVSLMIHPAVVWTTGRALDVGDAGFRAAILTAAMAPGINTYVFASMYGRAQRVAAASVLVATSASLVTALFWLSILP